MKNAEIKNTKVIHCRTFDDIDNDCLWDTRQLGGQNQDRRRQALVEVLRRIPETDYDRLKAFADVLNWAVPPKYCLAQANAFPAVKKIEIGRGKVRGVIVVFLTPNLEETAEDIRLGVIAHELAHLVLGHKLRWRNAEQYDAQEEDVFRRLCEWGFEKAAKKHRAFCRRRDSISKHLK
jgi:hypothetical protein